MFLVLTLIQTSTDGRGALDNLYNVFYNELFIGGLVIALIGSCFIALFNKRAGMVLASTTFIVGFIGLMTPYVVTLLRAVTATSAQ